MSGDADLDPLDREGPRRRIPAIRRSRPMNRPEAVATTLRLVLD